MNEVTRSAKVSPAEVLDQLTAACDWADISNGRAIQYKKLFKELYWTDKRSREHIFAYNELADLVEVYELWRHEIEKFPGLKDKIKAAFGSGPVLREDERPANSGNRPRNDAFPILLAGKLNRAGIPVVAVDGAPVTHSDSSASQDFSRFLAADIVVTCKGTFVAIECKRPQSKDIIGERAGEARKQLNGKNGIIAIDCSAALRPMEEIMDAPSEGLALTSLDKRLEVEAKPIVKTEFRENVLGLILYMRAPVHTIHKLSSILSFTGKPFTVYQQVTAATLLFVGNAGSRHADVYRSIRDRYLASLSANGRVQESPEAPAWPHQ